MLKNGLPARGFYALGFLVCAALLAYAYYLQFEKHLEPCPLCIFQRLFYAGTGIVFLLAVLHNPGRLGKVVYGIFSTLLASGGAAVAARQVWLQHLPADQVPECGPGLDYMLDAFPLNQTLRMVLRGSGECAKVDWRFLGFSIAEWSLLIFVLLAIYSLFLMRKKNA